MNGLDIALLVVLLFFLIRGIFRGFIKEITSVAGVVVGFLLGSRYYTVAADALKPLIQNPAYRQALGFLILFLVIFIVISLLGLLLDFLFKLTLSKATNSTLGAMIALAKGVVLSAVVLMATEAFIGPQSPFYQNSVSWPYLKHVTYSLKQLVPEDLQQALNYRLETLKPLVPKLPGEKDTDPGQGPVKGEEPPPWKPVENDSDTGEPPAPAWPGQDGQKNE